MIFNQPEDEETNVEQLKRIGEGVRWFVIYLACIALGLGVLALISYASAAEAPARSATITFAKPVKYTDGTAIEAGTVVTYNVYQGAKGSASKAKVATITATATTINSGLQPGETCWQVTAIANGVESERSAEGCKSFAWPATETVTITVT